ncbi:hypothetical protein AAMO2058_000159800 [Amorphochlora amoebiformis]
MVPIARQGPARACRILVAALCVFIGQIARNRKALEGTVTELPRERRELGNGERGVMTADRANTTRGWESSYFLRVISDLRHLRVKILDTIRHLKSKKSKRLPWVVSYEGTTVNVTEKGFKLQLEIGGKSACLDLQGPTKSASSTLTLSKPGRQKNSTVEQVESAGGKVIPKVITKQTEVRNKTDGARPKRQPQEGSSKLTASKRTKKTRAQRSIS